MHDTSILSSAVSAARVSYSYVRTKVESSHNNIMTIQLFGFPEGCSIWRSIVGFPKI